jgi:glycosyltransferase involved in cell wall biosynthesis
MEPVMPGLRNRLRRSLIRLYLDGSAALLFRLLNGRSAERDFRRVIVVAALGRNNGITRGARLQVQALQSLGIDAELLDATPALRNPFFRLPHKPGSVYVIHNDGTQTASLIGGLLPHAAAGYRIAYWAWELPDPPDWAEYDRNVDEIWTPSAFSRDSLLRQSRRPIHVVPHRVAPNPMRIRPPGQPFTFLTMADTRSSLSRKNPRGAVEAFHRAFGGSPSARLLLKLTGKPEEIAGFEAELGAILRGGTIEIIKTHLDEAGLAALFGRSDALLSLHRAEGFGLPMLEAMSHGIPSIATGWSGNLEFMNDDNSMLVPYRLIPVTDPTGIYAGSRWAEPDLDVAAEMLRSLAASPKVYAQLAAAAHRTVTDAYPCFPIAAEAAKSTAIASAA